MSIPLDAIVSNASEGDYITCTLSPTSVQVILFALSFIERRDAWKADYYDEVTDIQWDQIEAITANVSTELLT